MAKTVIVMNPKTLNPKLMNRNVAVELRDWEFFCCSWGQKVPVRSIPGLPVAFAAGHKNRQAA